MPEFSGQLTRAPVVYVLCQIRFSAVLKMADYLPSIQEALREQFPRFRRETLNALELSVPGGSVVQRTDDRWVLNDAAETSGYLINQGQFVFHTTAYTSFEEFLRHTLAGIQEVARVAKVSLIERIGLRYIDFVVPDRGEEVGQYLQPGLAGVSLRPLGFQQDTLQQFTSARTDAGRLVLKVSTGIQASVVPGDLQPMPLKTKAPVPDRQTTLLDSDHFSEDGFNFEIERLASVIRQLHLPISRVFKAAITNHAWEKWK